MTKARQPTRLESKRRPTAARRAPIDRKAIPERTKKTSRERILAVAAQMFAEHGMKGVGLRAIAAEACVNLASIAYHFGSKSGLLEVLFSERAAPIAQERLRLLAACMQVRKPKLEDVLDAFLRPALTLGVEPQFGGPAFVKLRARLGMEPESTAHQVLSNVFDHSSGEFIKALVAVLPDIPRPEVEWRFHFMLGSMFYTMANSGRIQSLTKGRIDPSNVTQALHYMIPFLAAGFRSPPVKNEPHR